MAKFSDLPQELRDIIWKFAIRPEGPTAHYFSVYHWSKDAHLVVPQWSIRHSIDGSADDLTDFFMFAAPRCGRDGTFSWVLGNHSAYMEDSALWTTCRDSRSHMIRRFRPDKTSRRMSQDPQYPGVIFYPATVTAVLQRDDGERQRFTIQPKQDLVIIQTLPGSCISWDRNIDNEVLPPIDDLWDQLPWNTLLYWSSKYASCWPNNIAIEFDPTWLEQIDKHIRQFDGAIYLKDVGALWFVDYRLKRDPKGMGVQISTFLQKNRRVFNAMGRRFVEVYQCERGDWAVPATESDGYYGGGAFDFVNRLEDAQYLFSSSDEYEWRHRGWCDFGVLACEPL